jgi:hypothetical protein
MKARKRNVAAPRERGESPLKLTEEQRLVIGVAIREHKLALLDRIIEGLTVLRDGEGL